MIANGGKENFNKGGRNCVMPKSKTIPKRSVDGVVESRRKFLTSAAVTVGGAAALAAPNIARAQETFTLKFQSTWPAKDIFHEYAQDYVRIVNELSGGRLKLDLLAAGAVVGALQMQDAVIAGALDGGHGVTAYWYGKNKAYSLFGTPPAFGWNANQMIGWMKYGGGQALYDELVQDILGLQLVGFLYGPMPTQPLGWFQEPVESAEDITGLKYRTVGLSADLNNEMGVAVTIMGGGDIVPAMDRGLLDAAEFNNPSSDRLLGFPDVSKTYMLKSYHQSAECFEVIFNKAKYDQLPPELQTVLRVATEAASADMSWKAMDRYSNDLEAMQAEQGVQVYETPESVLQAQLDAWNTVIENLSGDPFFAKVIDSQKAWAKRVVGFQLKNEVGQEMAYNHFFGA
jgi:TRAP-type mannitol/chloroaromatic compound transport system substrate-binding protein